MMAFFLPLQIALSMLTASASTLEYSVVMNKGPAGTMDVRVDPDGSRHVSYQYNDRGRGPSTVTDIVLGPGGSPSAVSVTGVDYYKVPVAERFAATAAGASWSSSADEGTSLLVRGKAYMPNAGTPEDLAILARALLNAPGHEMDLLPTGRGRIEKALVRQVSAGGRTKTISLNLISGLDFQPVPIWLDEKGALFQEGDTWIHSVLKGWEESSAALIAVQETVLKDRMVAEARKLQRRPATPVAFVHATLFDSEEARLLPRTTVVVRGDRIEAVGPDGAVAVPAGAEMIDATGKTLMPGLVDMHVHIATDPDGLLDIMAGVTTVRDLGDDMDELLARRKRFDSGEQIGPRIWMAGLIDGKGTFAAPINTLVSTPEEARAAIDLYADHGYRQIKIYSSIKPDLVPAMIAHAHERGLRVSGHIPAEMTMSDAVDDGYDEVQHANFWFLNFMPPEVNAKSNTMARFTEVGAHAKDLVLESPAVDSWIRKLQSHHIVVDPTLGTFETMFLGAPRKPDPALEAWIARLPPAQSRGNTGSGLGKGEQDRQDYARSFAQMLRMTKKLYDAGITIVAGTDALASLTLPHELQNYVRAGIPPAKALQIATLGAARVMHHDGEQGSIRPGRNADLILVDGNPVQDITALRNVMFVMKGGIVYDIPAIARSVGIAAAN